MSGQDAIRILNLGKQYRIYKHPVDSLLELVLKQTRHVSKTALEDVNLTVKRGEIVGILGRNGAGKSTLLKIIAGTLESSTGEIKVNGRISSILELGTGFHPEYTGRENIFMGGFCMGLTRSEINSRLDKIISFSELGEVIDQPFKTYSTGMQARLTFSTAISVEPDVLIVDEALSVGDAKFQKKCISWMNGLSNKNATILLVTHDTNTITALCDRAIILESGKIYSQGDPKKITEEYQNLLFGRPEKVKSNKGIGQKSNAQRVVDSIDADENRQEGSHVRYGNSNAKIIDWGLYDLDGNAMSNMQSGTEFKLEMYVNTLVDITDISCGFAIKDKRGTVLWGMTNISNDNTPYTSKTGEQFNVTIKGKMWLASGEYFITLGIAHDKDGEKIDFIEDAIRFSVTGTNNIFTTSIVNLQSQLAIQNIKNT
ncbi:MAG: ABC transporter ATP-binding protein [Gammaproteobacteria bacterium]|nr:ABC transporter ATP-binding protein [Gammaproteobacteria bacterium]